MNVVEYENAAAMWRDAQVFLTADPANNTQMLGAISRLLERGAHHEQRFFLALDSQRDGSSANVIGAAFRAESGVLFGSAMPPTVARALGYFLRSNDVRLTGVSGPTAVSVALASSSGLAHHLDSRRLLYQLRGEPDLGRASGELRAVTLADFDLTVAWYRAFEGEAHMPPAPTPLPDRVRLSILENTYSFWIDNGTPVAMAGARKLPAASARIGPVYTPPKLRGRGYAQAVVAAVSHQVQQDGPRTVFLFTDASNPASNKAYQRIGFVHVGDHAQLMFDEATS